MDDFLVNLVFAGDILGYFFKLDNIYWENPYEDIFKKGSEKMKFNKDVGWAVWKIWEENADDFAACYFELRKAGIHNKEDFSKCALSAADSYFSEGYNPGSFLGYCAIVLAVSTRYFEYPSNSVPETAVNVVALVLQAHQLTGQFYEHGGWDGIHKTSSRLRAAFPIFDAEVKRRGV